MIVKPFIDSELRNDSVCTSSFLWVDKQLLCNLFSIDVHIKRREQTAVRSSVLLSALTIRNRNFFFIIFKMKFVSYNCFFFINISCVLHSHCAYSSWSLLLLCWLSQSLLNSVPPIPSQSSPPAAFKAMTADTFLRELRFKSPVFQSPLNIYLYHLF